MAVTRRAALKGSLTGAAAFVAYAGMVACGSANQQEPSEASASVESSQSGASNSQELSGSQSQVQSQNDSRIAQLVSSMSLEHKVAQLFIIAPEQLTGVGQVVAAGESTRVALASMPIGGLIYNTANLLDPEQLKTMLSNTREYSRQSGAKIGAFLAIDEEGGTVSRLANVEGFEVERFDTTASMGADPIAAHDRGAAIGRYLVDYGFNLDFAPVADVLTNPNNTVIGNRAFSSDAQQVADCVVGQIEGFRDAGCLSCVKHFPGHGDTAEDSHVATAISERSLEELKTCEYLPFEAAIRAGVAFVMIGHISLPNILGDMLPASLSSRIISDELRGELGYDGVVISDSFQMEAITNSFDSSEAAISFINAGGDVVLMPQNFEEAYRGVLMAARQGRISLDRIDESVRRVVAVKLSAGLID